MLDCLFSSPEKLFLTSVASIGLYILIIICFRLLGKKGLSDLNVADLILVIIIGESLGGIIPGECPIMHAVVCILSIVIANYFIDILTYKFPGFKKLIEGLPVYIIEKGKINYESLKKVKLTDGDLQEALRINGMNDDLDKLSDDLFAVLETDGKISIFHK